MSTANDTNANEVDAAKENIMSFHKVTPVKKTRKPAAQTAKKVAKPAAKKAAPKRRPVSHKG